MIAVTLFAASATSNAAEVNGAFGLKLGDTFSGSASGRTPTDGTPMYSFTPQSPFRSFNDYYVTLTPKSKRISRTWAIGDQESDPVCDKERAVIKAIISKKSGGEWKDQLLSNVELWSAGDKQIALKCAGFGDVSIQIIYRDDTMTDIEEKERIEIETDSGDSSGL